MKRTEPTAQVGSCLRIRSKTTTACRSDAPRRRANFRLVRKTQRDGPVGADVEGSTMRYWLAGSLFLLIHTSAPFICAQNPDQGAEHVSLPAATLGVPRPAATLGTP